jgi:chorismate synthase
LSGSSIGKRLVLTSFGESHGRCVGAVLDGCPAGLAIDEKDIQKMLDLRKPGQSNITTQRKEEDKVEILSGAFRGFTTGAPISMIIWNKDQDPRAYDSLKIKLRPGHSDYPAMIKYKKFNDYRGGGRFSGRLTATFVMGGAIARKLLKESLGVETHSYTLQIGKIRMNKSLTSKMTKSIYSNEVRCPDKTYAKKMKGAIINARKKGDSLGGIIESITTNLPTGIGEPIFSSIESDMSKAIFSIQYKKGKIVTKTNNAGGILGGISTGMPIVMRVAFKPVSSIAKKQTTIDIKTKKLTILSVKGRHDPCVVPRAPPVIDSLVSLTLADLALQGGFIKSVL